MDRSVSDLFSGYNNRYPDGMLCKSNSDSKIYKNIIKKFFTRCGAVIKIGFPHLAILTENLEKTLFYGEKSICFFIFLTV